MRGILRLLTALPLAADRSESDSPLASPTWGLAGAGGLVIGLTWLLFHQASLNLAGPFAAAGVVLLADTAFTGARGARGVASLAQVSVAERASVSVPGTAGAGAAAVAGLFSLRAILFLLVAPMPSLMVQAAIASRVAQVLTLRGGGEDGQPEAAAMGLSTPSAAERIVLLISAVPLLMLPELLVRLELPRRVDTLVSGGELLVMGLIALASAVAAAMLTMAWARARFGKVGADAWFAAGMSAEVTALFVIVARLSVGG